jgi:hypothetical protein
MWNYSFNIFTFSYTASILDLKVGDSYISPTHLEPRNKQHGVITQKLSL